MATPETDYDVKVIKTTTKKIKQPENARLGIIAEHPFRCYIVGASQSGKSNLLLNLLTRDKFYKDYFDYLFIISPTACNLDASYQCIEKETEYKIQENLFYLDCDTDALDAILKIQEEKKNKKSLVVLDDIVSFKRFCNSQSLLQFAIMSRHYNLSMFVLSQAFHLIPKSVRLNMSWVLFFKGSDLELKTIVEQYSPAGYSQKKFKELVVEATEEPYTFLYIDLNRSMHKGPPRYRKNLTIKLLRDNKNSLKKHKVY